MLVITRKTSESILIGDEIEITVTEIGAERVKIGINAPKGVPILRKELLETRELNREASAASGPREMAELLKLLHLHGVEEQADPKKK
ncbi:carbon storage regulator [Caproiciproducens sp. NJN-50]|uniref:carbon storage regulator n=1 Tax=Acutalibacteraceae TaxID=3082771 RepID=UPI000FFE18D3|nr:MULTISPECIES: carbon storage regulator [Acutalibacteraceae]QAT50703.1 carbon storage regulator [Caproiciproducens sp. NJN-50]